MSKQLAISSAFATFAMAAMALLHTPDRSGLGGSESFVPLQAGIELPSLPQPSLIR